MTNDERDKIIIETHRMTSDVFVAVFGNGKAGIKEELTVVKTKQDLCPARAESMIASKRSRQVLKATVAASIAAVISAGAAVASIVWG